MMRVRVEETDGKILEIDPEDELLARTPEDERTDLDEEGYPINDQPDKPVRS